MSPTDRRVSSRDPARHLGPQCLDEGAQMSGGRSYQDTFGVEVREQVGRSRGRASSGRGPGGARRARVCSCGCWRRPRRRRHSGHRTPDPRSPRRWVCWPGSCCCRRRCSRPRAPTTRRSPSRSRSPTRSTRSTRSSGVEANSYEMWALTYDYLVGYSMKDMSPAARAGEELGDLRRRQDLDLPHPRRREVVRRPAADRRRRRLHLQPGARTARRRRTTGRATSTTSRRSPRPTRRPSC